jgi:large subunit ribosomal protein L18
MNIDHNRVSRRKRRVRSAIRGTAERPRISIHKSNKYLYAQAIDDVAGNTIAAVSGLAKKKDSIDSSKISVANSAELGRQLAQLLKAAKVETAVFDRGANAYKGNVKAFADGLREAGIKI